MEQDDQFLDFAESEIELKVKSNNQEDQDEQLMVAQKKAKILQEQKDNEISLTDQFIRWEIPQCSVRNDHSELVFISVGKQSSLDNYHIYCRECIKNMKKNKQQIKGEKIELRIKEFLIQIANMSIQKNQISEVDKSLINKSKKIRDNLEQILQKVNQQINELDISINEINPEALQGTSKIDNTLNYIDQYSQKLLSFIENFKINDHIHDKSSQTTVFQTSKQTQTEVQYKDKQDQNLTQQDDDDSYEIPPSFPKQQQRSPKQVKQYLTKKYEFLKTLRNPDQKIFSSQEPENLILHPLRSVRQKSTNLTEFQSQKQKNNNEINLKFINPMAKSLSNTIALQYKKDINQLFSILRKDEGRKSDKDLTRSRIGQSTIDFMDKKQYRDYSPFQIARPNYNKINSKRKLRQLTQLQ